MPSLFLALFPPSDVARRIADAAAALPDLREVGATLTPADRLHITVAYLGDHGHNVELVADVSRRMETVNCLPIDVEFSRLRTFGSRATARSC